MKVVIIGTGGMAKELWGMLTSMGEVVAGFVSENSECDLVDLMSLPILGADDWFVGERAQNCVIANGSPKVRRKIQQRYRISAHCFPAFIHPASIRLGTLVYGGGTTIMPGGVIQPDVRIGGFTHINMGVTIGHDTVIGDFCVVNHNAGISGNVTIGDGVLIGAGATIRENLTIGDGATVGMGAVVTKDVPAGETWVGCPAKPMTRRGRTEEEIRAFVNKAHRATTYAELYEIDAPIGGQQ